MSTAVVAAGLAAVALATGLVVAAVPGVAAASHANAKVVKVGTARIPHVGVVLTTGSGLTLYHFAEDPRGKVTCTGVCAKIYPPFTAPKGAHISAPKGVKGLSLISSGHGHWQVAFDDAALYRFAGDTKKGQAKAQGLLGKWFVAMKSGISAAATPAVATTSTTTTAPSTTTTAPRASTTAPGSQPVPTMPPQPVQTPAPAPVPVPAPAPTTTTAPPATTTTAPPTTTTTVPSGGGVGF